MTPLTSSRALDQFFLEARSQLLDLAAILDRVSRGPEALAVAADARLARIRMALDILHDNAEGRAERIQRIFSQEYDPAWTRPRPRI